MFKPPYQTSLRKEPEQERSRALVEAIVEATARVLVHEGIDALTTNRVAQVAGVSVGSLYQYFPGKEAMLAALIERELGADLEAAHALLAQAQALSPYALLHVFFEQAIADAASNRALHQLLLPLIPHLERARLVHERVEAFVGLIDDWLWARRSTLGASFQGLTRAAFSARVALVVRTAEAMLNLAKLEQPLLLDRPEQLLKDMLEVCGALLGLDAQG